jgi:RimJ/RimL family protein N-acetyltransferase
VLRAVAAGDLETLFDQQADPEANQLASVPARTHEDFLAHWGRILADPSVLKRAVVVDGALAGHVIVFLRDGRREIGYWLGRAYWGRGIASRAVAEVLGLERRRPLFAGVVASNLGSLRVLEKAGFVRVGETPFTDPASGAPRAGILLELDGKLG